MPGLEGEPGDDEGEDRHRVEDPEERGRRCRSGRIPRAARWRRECPARAPGGGRSARRSESPACRGSSTHRIEPNPPAIVAASRRGLPWRQPRARPYSQLPSERTRHMGWLGNLLGSTDDGLIQNGLLGRGEVLSVDASGMTMQMGNGLVERKCNVTLNVMLDGQQPYQAVASQRIQEIYIPQLSGGGAVVAVRVDPADKTRVQIDFATEPPTVTLPASEGHNSAAWILENGKPVTVVLVANQPIGVKSAKGDDVHALTLTIATGVETPVPDSGRQRRSRLRPAAALPGIEAAREGRRRAERRRRRLGRGSCEPERLASRHDDGAGDREAPGPAADSHRLADATLSQVDWSQFERFRDGARRGVPARAREARAWRSSTVTACSTAGPAPASGRRACSWPTRTSSRPTSRAGRIRRSVPRSSDPAMTPGSGRAGRSTTRERSGPSSRPSSRAWPPASSRRPTSI